IETISNRMDSRRIKRSHSPLAQSSSDWSRIGASMPPTPQRLWLLAMGFSAAFSVAAQDQGPGFVLQGEGGLVTAFALDPRTSTTIYAATARGLYRTTDGGSSWSRLGTGLRDHSLLSVAVDPHSPRSLYAATDTGGVFRSDDAGERWVESNTGISARYV